MGEFECGWHRLSGRKLVFTEISQECRTASEVRVMTGLQRLIKLIKWRGLEDGGIMEIRQ